jgi:hypothetical protein
MFRTAVASFGGQIARMGQSRKGYFQEGENEMAKGKKLASAKKLEKTLTLKKKLPE